jgi:hypothetical protein
LLDDSLTNNRHLGRGAFFLRVERTAFADGPVPRTKVSIANAENGRKPVAVSGDHLARGSNRRRCNRNGGRLPLDCRRIGLGQRDLAVGTTTNPTRNAGAVANEQHVFTQALYGFVDPLFGAFTHANHGNHRRHTDDDAQSRQGRAQLVGPQ